MNDQCLLFEQHVLVFILNFWPRESAATPLPEEPLIWVEVQNSSWVLPTLKEITPSLSFSVVALQLLYRLFTFSSSIFFHLHLYSH